MRKLIFMGLLLLSILPIVANGAIAPSLSVMPIIPIQGEAMKVSLGKVKIRDVKSLTFDGVVIPVLEYLNKPTAFVGIDLNKKPGIYMFTLELRDGSKINYWIYIAERTKIKAPLGIPTKLGGNTPASATALISNLSIENTLLSSLTSDTKMLWSKNFRFPLSDVFITDPYGYSRVTGQYNISHKGTDFRAAEATKVYAMNKGVVRLVRKMEIYGNTIVIDHGLGIMTFYMHLSEISVKEGEIVDIGSIIGKSGSTGYAESPHLHVSVRVNNTSIDPMRFMEFFK